MGPSGTGPAAPGTAKGSAWASSSTLTYRSARFVKHVHVMSFKDVNVEELAHADPFSLPGGAGPGAGDRPPA